MRCRSIPCSRPLSIGTSVQACDHIGQIHILPRGGSINAEPSRRIGTGEASPVGTYALDSKQATNPSVYATAKSWLVSRRPRLRGQALPTC